MTYIARKEVIAKRIAALFQEGDIVNLGIGLPTMATNYVSEEKGVVFQSENGFLGMGQRPENIDYELVDAGGQPSSLLKGGSFFDSATSFAMIRGGHIDYTVLGMLEVDQSGSLANYTIPHKMVPGMGGAMDLVVGAKKVVVAGLHFDKNGHSKLCSSCTLPLTAYHEVDIVITDVGFFTIDAQGFVLEEVFSPYTVSDVQRWMHATLSIAPHCTQKEII